MLLAPARRSAAPGLRAALQRACSVRAERGVSVGGPKKGDRVTVAMSGGVDSSVAALQLAQGDYDLSAVYMRNWSTLDESGSMQPGSGGAAGCAWQQEWNDVQRVCAHLGGIPVRLVDLSREYWLHVFEPAVGQWADGQTPNPDVECNRSVKFGALLNHVLGTELSHRGSMIPQAHNGASWLATGHYAQLSHHTDAVGAPRVQLRRAYDQSKDQSYYLSSVPEERLRHSLFPLGGLLKRDVRALARKYELPTAEKSESMGLCFVGERGTRRHGFGDFLSEYVQGVEGDICAPDGTSLGRHRGLHLYTIGQRARLSGKPERFFVARKEPATKRLIVVPGSTHPMLQCTALDAEAFQWIASDGSVSLHGAQNLQAQVRYQQDAVLCRVQLQGGGVRVHFDEPVTAVAMGQVVALYDGDVCLGSGVIDHVETLA